jgi:hypothetical protein
MNPARRVSGCLVKNKLAAKPVNSSLFLKILVNIVTYSPRFSKHGLLFALFHFDHFQPDNLLTRLPQLLNFVFI